MVTDGAALVEGRAGITFGVELYIPWDAPEAVVNLQSDGVVNLGSIPDAIGPAGRRPGAAESRVLQGRDVRSVRVLVLDQNFHDVTIVDMGDVPESSVSLQELSLLRQQWLPAILRHMVWLQQDLEVMRAEAKKRFRQTRPSSCVYCGTWIKCDMYRHVAKFHLDLAQLWGCPVSRCTVWKGTPQDCMDHVRGAHNVPWVVKSASIEQFVPPWTVRHQVWSKSLMASHSGISTDVLLFSDINLSLVHHYQIHKRGLPHIAFRNNYLARLRTLLPPAVAQSQEGMLSPVSSGPASLRHARSAELELESPRKTRRARRRMQPILVMGESVGDIPILTIQDSSDVQGAIVYDCRPPLLPVSLQLKDIGALPLRPTVVSASLAAPPGEDGMAISGVGPEGIVLPELGVAPLVDSGTDLEDELSTPNDSPSTGAPRPEGVGLPRVRPAPPDVIDFELEKALLQVSILPVMVTPIVDPVVDLPGAPSLYPAPPLPVLPMDQQVPVSGISPLREVAGSPVLDVFPSYKVSPACSVYGPVTSPISPSLREDDVSRPPSSPAMMDQHLSRDGELLRGESTDLPLLAMPMTPRPVAEEMVLGLAVGSRRYTLT